jgi:hypothetical protein
VPGSAPISTRSPGTGMHKLTYEVVADGFPDLTHDSAPRLSGVPAKIGPRAASTIFVEAVSIT